METADILPTRIPFEESTIWGRNYNISNSPDALCFVLKPGEMLVIPPGWWHSVASLDTTVSVNIWSALPETDNKAREKEAATRIISQICKKSELIRYFFISIFSAEFYIKNSVASAEDGEFGDIENLQNVIERDFVQNKNIRPIEDTDRIYHALSHPSVIESFLKVYKEL